MTHPLYDRIRSCVVYGNTRSDEPLFRALDHTVGVNPSEALAEIAATTSVGTDLREAYRLGRELPAQG